MLRGLVAFDLDEFLQARTHFHVKRIAGRAFTRFCPYPTLHIGHIKGTLRVAEGTWHRPLLVAICSTAYIAITTTTYFSDEYCFVFGDAAWLTVLHG